MIEIKRGDTKALYFYAFSEKLIIKRSKSSGTVSLTILEPHGITAPQTCGVAMFKPNSSFDTASVATASTPTTRTLTYSLGSDTVPEIVGNLGILTVPVDITGDTWFFYVKALKSDTDANKIFGTSWTSHTDATNGITTVELSTVNTALTIGSYYYEVQRVTSGSKVYTMEQGELKIVQDITTATT